VIFILVLVVLYFSGVRASRRYRVGQGARQVGLSAKTGFSLRAVTGPEGQIMAGSGGLRASQADREQVIEVLKVAFVQGRLDKGEFDARLTQAFISRTYAELTAVTADIPAGLGGLQPWRQPAGRGPGRLQARSASGTDVMRARA
jgi:DUF1707 SHOCT-like domain